MADPLLIAAGFILILLGAFLLLIVGAGLEGKAGGLILIGPIPIAFGGKSAKAVIITFLLILFIFFSAMAILLRGW